MPDARVTPYGSWKSPITSGLIAGKTVSLAEILLDGDDIYWLEGRPTEGGRYVIVKRSSNGKTVDMTPPPFNARTRVHEYGGGAYAVKNGVIYFSNFSDHRWYRQVPGSDPEAITPGTHVRHADAVYDAPRHRLIAVREDHTSAGPEPVNTLVAIGLDGGSPPPPSRILVSGNDFYSSPRISPDGSRLAWLTWNHPNMPWDGTELWVGEFSEDGSLGKKEMIAGDVEESVFQPAWSPGGILHFVSDRTGWWNLYRWKEGRIENLCPKSVEFGVPQWLFGFATYAIESDDQIICTFNDKGSWHLATLDIPTHKLKKIATTYADIRYIKSSAGRVLFWGSSPSEPASIVLLDLASGTREVLRESSRLEIDPGYISIPRDIEFPTENGLTAHALFYPPMNRDFTAPPDERPPLLVKSHGGPTSAASAMFNLGIQYWTSRGIAVVDVNYGGSTGYGRAYRQRLNGQWGVVDVDDCVNVARHLVNQGTVDGKRLTIDGGSAGGYTTLCALTFRNVFKAGASYYGISDLKVMDEDTHKFESRYSNSLLGPPAERERIYHERSPIHYIDRLSCPLILFQGDEDKIVPPNQAEMMFEGVRAKGLPVAYLLFRGEQHGFCGAENIKRSLDAELYFYARVFGFELADPVEPVKIENL
jgi:dipeptidyl aminopeptidase/acylaminoacyl peptidase